MSAQDELRAAIDREQTRLRDEVPGDRETAILAILRRRDLRNERPSYRSPDLITGVPLADPGGNRALQLCVQGEDDPTLPAPPDMDEWAERFLRRCDHLAEAELALGQSETGFMRLVEGGHGRFDAWIATKRVPASWRERADFDWWGSHLAGALAPEWQMLEAGATRDGEYYRRAADLHIKRMTYQFGYPSDAVIGGCSIQTYRDVLGWLIARVLRNRNRTPAVIAEGALVEILATDLELDPFLAQQAVSGFTLDRENAAYHAVVPGVAAAPLVRFGGDRIALSLHGLTTEPLLFLTRELRRRDAQEYHNSAFLREDVFRQDIYALFQDKRFITSAGRIQLRRKEGNLRTDIDAAVFDRKSGTLALFELKSQDPFARSTAELQRQRDNLLYANRQVSGTLDWIKRHGADEILSRIDTRTAKTFRAQKVYPFVLGRYLAHFNDGAAPDPRAAWGTWPQVLRLLEQQPIAATDANPIASLFNRLAKDGSPISVPVDGDSREIVVGDMRVVVHPSFSAFQAH